MMLAIAPGEHYWKRLRRLAPWAAFVFAFATGATEARTIVTCEDADGERFFSTRCPPGTQQVDSRQVNTGTPAAAAPADDGGDPAPDTAKDGTRQLRDVVVYVAPDCVPCEFLERHLETRRVAFRRIDVEADPSAFEAVQGRLETVGVPVLTVGEELLTGFQPKRIDQTLVTQGVLLATDVPNYEAPAPVPPLPTTRRDEASPPPAPSSERPAASEPTNAQDRPRDAGAPRKAD
jgi:glutaredoxin 3